MIGLEDGERFWLIETRDHESVWFEWVVEHNLEFRKGRDTYASRDDAELDAVAALTELRSAMGGFYVCPNHRATGGFEACCDCGGWETDDTEHGRVCDEAKVAGA